MNHLSELLERLRLAEKSYKEASSSLDGGSLEFIIAKQELKEARFAWLSECEHHVIEKVLKGQEESV
jgi:hypothetical protein